MGLIGTRSLTTEIPGIDELVEARRGAHPRGHQGLRRAAEDPRRRQRRGRAARRARRLRGQRPRARLRAAAQALCRRSAPGHARSRSTKAAWDTVPQVAPLFWSFRIMVGLGLFFILLTGTFFVLSARRRLDRYPWLLKVAVLVDPAAVDRRRVRLDRGRVRPPALGDRRRAADRGGGVEPRRGDGARSPSSASP